MNKVIHLSLARKSVPILMDVVQSATAPSIEFVLDDFTPPSNARARIYIKKDGGEVYNNCTLSGNVVTYTPTAGSFDVPGQCVAQLELVQGSTVAVSWRIFVTVEPNLINGSAAPASTEYGALTQLIVNAQRYDGIIGANNITGYNNRQGWTVLTSGQDLNSVLTPGTYTSANGSITNTLLNIPTNPPLGGGFKMVVENMGGSSYFRQTITMPQNTVLGQLATVEKTYKRQTTDGGRTWSDWIFEPTRVELNAIANRGGKNLLPNNATTQTVNGITYTRNADGSITANGTATSVAPLLLSNVTGLFSRDKLYRLSGCPSGGGNSTYALYLGGSPNRIDNGNGVTFYGDGVSRTCQIHIFEGVTVNDLTFYPMIREASIQDDTYVPYGMSNAELTARQPKVLYVEVKPADYPLSQVYGGYMTAPYTIPEGTEILGVMLFATAGVSQYPVIPVTPSKTTVRFWMPTNSYTSVGAYVTVR